MFAYQDQILVGTVLGGSSLVKPPKGVNYYLSMRDKEEAWLKFKMYEMSDYYKELKSVAYGRTFRSNSCCATKLTEMYAKLYENGKRKVTMDLLDPLRDIGIAVWYIDGGSKTGRDRKNAYINTTKLGEEGTKVVWQYFNEVEIHCNINRDGERLKVLFTVQGTEALFGTIEPCLPEFMLHRL
jgi:hypothetical protein